MTGLQKKVLDFQEKFYTDRGQALKDMYALLDKSVA